MELIPYQEFAQLRMRDFFPANARIFLDETGSTECAIGSAATEGLGFTYFAWREGEPRRTAEVALDFREECPPDIGQKILDAMQLPLRPGIPLDETCRVLGQPEYSHLSSPQQGTARFVCGTKSPYFVTCHFTDGQGLIGVCIFRKDYQHD